ncbi:MAG: hypothetical protein AAGU23_02820 [Bacillota bacterium]|nr:hypothetical protein [Bacillota bacterium]HWR56034.1 hypothetical protein [Negativicutes bacterium]
MEERFRELVSRLVLLGYTPCERKTILQEAAGKYTFDEMNFVQRTRAIRNLEKYEVLGANFLAQYSK